MRRALLAAALAVPALSLAQVSAPVGSVIDIDNFNAVTGSSYVNAAQCGGAAPAPVRLEWNLGGVTPLRDDTYRIFASNTAPGGGGAEANFCPEENSTGGGTADVRAGQVDSVPAERGVQTRDADGQTLATLAGFTCAAASESRVVHVCVHWYDQNGSTRKGVASGRFIIQLSAPPAPTRVSAAPAGETRLFVRWTRSSGGVAADHYVAQATRLSEDEPPVDLAPPISSSRVTANETTISGLENGARYRVEVRAASVGGNFSPPSEAVEARPAPVNDFFEAYRGAGGRDEGGCGTGGSGVLALAGVALAMLLRRRK